MVRPLAQIRSDSAYYTYVASVHPTTLLIELRSETKIDHKDPIRAEVVDTGPNSIVTVPAGTARTEIDLPIWLIRALREAHDHGNFDAATFNGIAEKRLVSCLEAATYGISAPTDGSTSALVTAACATVRF
ncbi:hypothetical protein [Nocardia gipuzkoensis]|uniref:hypothetical protein n=1 Tax=Nocardia gipuzkoensis TaxID=2749991 RepID=UPI003EE379B0